MRFRLLGPLEVLDDRGQPLVVGGPRARALLATLLLHANQTVHVPELIESVWGEQPPQSARQTVHFFVHRLRRALADRGRPGPHPSGLVTESTGYQLQVDPGELDVEQFEGLIGEARAARSAGRTEQASACLAEALRLWGGEPLTDLTSAPFAPAAAARLGELRVAAAIERAELELLLGHHEELVAELDLLVRAYPLREQVRAQLALALYRSGRQAEALEACRAARRTLVDELGIEPGPELRALEQAILKQDASLELPPAQRPAERQPARMANVVAREERRVVTVLAAICEHGHSRLDPEDARASHRETVARLGQAVERYGGRMQAAAGGSVLAVFGAPRAHDDDPERAVRAALELCASAPEAGDIELEVRVGVETGEALVGLVDETSPGSAVVLAVAGAVVDRAAALAIAAPANAVVVGSSTEWLTRQAIEYAELDPSPARAGRSRRWLATGLVDPGPAGAQSPLVEREHELALLGHLLTRARREHEAQLVTVVGGAGIGKSRLVQELALTVEADPEPITWHQGRSLAYGEGVMTFWALGDVVKERAGILETDTPEQAEAKLATIVADVIQDEASAAWVVRHLRPLVTADAEAAELGAGREQAFAAWRQFIAALAAEQPLVLVFDDLQWADDALLDFIDELAERAGPVALLIVCNTRPELLERRPAWGGGKRNVTTISLAPLSPAGTERLVAALLDEGERLDAATRAALVDHSGGNPLFVEEYVRMLHDQDERAWQDGEQVPLPVPDTVQQLITARLDTIAPGDKALLADAAVLGQVGWLGAVAAISGRARAELSAWLARMERRGLLRQARTTSVAGETEYAFRHVLARDVAYNQLPRAARAERHQRAATWIEALRPGRSEDHADLLAHHYSQALALCAAGDPGRGELLLELGRATFLAERGGEEVLREARDALLAAGRRARAAEAEQLLLALAWRQGRVADRDSHRERALELVDREGPSRSKASVLAGIASELTVASRPEAIEIGHEALAMAKALGLADLEARAIGAVGLAKVEQRGDPAGISDLERSIALFEGLHQPEQAIVIRINLASSLDLMGDLGGSAAAAEEARRLAEQFESAASGFLLRWLEALHGRELYWTGRWEQANRVAAAFLAATGSGAPHYLESTVRVFRGRIRLARGQAAPAERDSALALELARSTGDVQLLEPALAFRARLLLTLGRADEGGALVDELLGGLGGRPIEEDVGVDLPLAMEQLGRPASALDGAADTRWLQAAGAYLAGDHRLAADRYADIGARPDEALTRLRAARALAAGGWADEARRELAVVRSFARAGGASAWLTQAEEIAGSDEQAS